MDYAQALVEEASSAHAIFHEFILSLPDQEVNAAFLFFEGEDDPAFYLPHLTKIVKGKELITFICFGRSEVLKVAELVNNDGRAYARCAYFVDKDHTDILDPSTLVLDGAIFQTSGYSVENYLCCAHLFNRFWVEKLHLNSSDARRNGYLEKFLILHRSFQSKMKLLTTAILIGRGNDGFTACKMNLNNINLDKIIRLDMSLGLCKFVPGAALHFLQSSNIGSLPQQIDRWSLRRLCRTWLSGRAPSTYVRGKFELWFAVKFLQAMTSALSNKEAARQSGLKRATPNIALTPGSAFETLAGLVPCPADLEAFIQARFP